jgi:hypothetical protein
MLDACAYWLVERLFHHPIFVVGTGRSGTTLLLFGLGQHPAVWAAQRESPFIPYLGYLAHPFEARSNRQYHRDSLALSLEDVYRRVRRLCFESAFGERYGLRSLPARLKMGIDLRRRKQRWCAKTCPGRDEFAGLVRLYPRARFLYVFRNGIEVVYSRSRFPNMAQLTFEDQCETWAFHVNKYEYLLHAEEALVVRHERLVREPDRVWQEIFAAVDLSPDEAPIRFTKTTQLHPLDSPTQSQQDVARVFQERPPAHATWDHEQRATFKRICGSGMAALGYSMPF